MRKRLFALLLIFAISLSFAACGETVPSSEIEDSTSEAQNNSAQSNEDEVETTDTEMPVVTEEIIEEELYELKVGAGVGTIEFDPSIFPTEGFSGEVHDDPHVRVLLLEAGEKAAIVACELVNTPDEVISGIQNMIFEVAGVPVENIWVHSTHAITTPHKPGNEAVLEAARAALEQAIGAFAPATLGVGTIECDVNANRNIETPEGIVGGPYYGMNSTEYSNKTMTMLRFNGEDGEPLAFFISYGIKPTAIDNSEMKAGTRIISTDVPGKACTMVEESLGAPCLFCMPAAGDQYPKEMTLYYDLNDEGTHMVEVDLGVEKGLDIVARLGTEMGDKAISLAESISCDVGETTVELNSDSFVALERRMTKVNEVEVEVSVLAMGSVAFVGFKQELDAQTEKELQESSPYEHTLLVSFLNGDGKYMPHDAAYDYNDGKGTYEVLKTGFERGNAEKLVALAVELLEKIS